MTQTPPAAGPVLPPTGRPATRPDVVLILVDDMGYSDLGCFGSEIRTPHLDALAAQGVRLTQFYNGARCCPTRASLLTGRYAHQAGIGHMVRDLGHPAYQGYLNEECVTIAEALQPAGYRTVMAGKWHVGGQWSTDPQQIRRDAGQPGFPTPLQRGFERFFGTLAGAGSYFHPHTLMLEGELVDATDSRVQWGADETADGFYYTDAIGRYAAGQIARAAADAAPLFLYAAFTAPHWPLHALPEDLARYRGRYREGWDALRAARHARLKELGVVAPDWPLTPRDPEAPDWDTLSPERRDWEDARMAAYAAQVEAMDRSVGRIVAALRDAGRLEHTLLLFLSDNGGCAEFLREDGSHGSAAPLTRDGRPITVGNREGLLPGPPDTYMSYDLPWANASNTPFRRYKHWVHEGGIATPLIAHWPAGTAAGSRGGLSHSVGHLIDVLPTILDATGTPYPAQRAGRAGRALPPPEGESLLPLLVQDLSWQRQGPVFWEHEGNRAVRSAGAAGEHGRWKLVSQHPGPWELYDMRADRTELRDLAAEQPERARSMAAGWEDWAARCGVQPWEQIRPRRR
ncbi:MAG TPA: arylsulfatase [Chloroflexota bacterium]|nr:arylsulfatase [Chloroflexota bacterium]